MVVTCPLGMRIPAGPVSKRNPALPVQYNRHSFIRMTTAAGSGPDVQFLRPGHAVSEGCSHMVQQEPILSRDRMSQNRMSHTIA